MSSNIDARLRIPKDRIGTLKEGALHRDLKAFYASQHAQMEQVVGKYVVDVLHGDHVIEIQTANFGALRDKLDDLLTTHSVMVVYPIAVNKVLVKHTASGDQRRKSPKNGNALDLFDELVYTPTLLERPNLDLELAYVSVEEHREYDPKRAWRRRHWVVTERRLEEVRSQERFASMADLFDKFTERLPNEFTTATIASCLNTTRNKAQKFAYCFRVSEVIHAKGKDGNAVIYKRKN
ncbi:MAG: hypothetical protein OXG05_12680 [Gammaproteobacteria bacterium]|nr:hypothetical protein [Gammaproteobacteria bacterium]